MRVLGWLGSVSLVVEVFLVTSFIFVVFVALFQGRFLMHTLLPLSPAEIHEEPPHCDSDDAQVQEASVSLLQSSFGVVSAPDLAPDVVSLLQKTPEVFSQP
jgi:hypothetical protein